MKKVRTRFRQVELDDANFTRTALREKYEPEYNAWRNMKTRQKKAGLQVHPDFVAFADFLRVMGPKPEPSFTLDRIDHTDPDYAPDKVRWADKKTQTRNRATTVTIEHDGRVWTAAEIAETYGLRISTVRNRIKRGWSFEEVIAKPKSRGWPSRARTAPRHREVVIHEDYWPWLGPQSSLYLEDRFQNEQPDCSRYEYFEQVAPRDLERYNHEIDDANFILDAKEENRLNDDRFDLHMEYRTIQTPISSITEEHLDNLLRYRENVRLALEKSETFRLKSGEFHRRPNWEDYYDEDEEDDWRDEYWDDEDEE